MEGFEHGVEHYEVSLTAISTLITSVVLPVFANQAEGKKLRC